MSGKEQLRLILERIAAETGSPMYAEERDNGNVIEPFYNAYTCLSMHVEEDGDECVVYFRGNMLGRESTPLHPDSFLDVAESCLRDARLLRDISGSEIRLTARALEELRQELDEAPIQPGPSWEITRLHPFDGFMGYETCPEMEAYTPAVRRLLDHLDTVQIFTRAQVMAEDEVLPFLQQPLDASVGVELHVDSVRNGVYTLSFTAAPCRTGNRLDTDGMAHVAREMQTAADLLRELNARGPITIHSEELQQLRDFYTDPTQRRECHDSPSTKECSENLRRMLRHMEAIQRITGNTVIREDDRPDIHYRPQGDIKLLMKWTDLPDGAHELAYAAYTDCTTRFLDVREAEELARSTQALASLYRELTRDEPIVLTDGELEQLWEHISPHGQERGPAMESPT